MNNSLKETSGDEIEREMPITSNVTLDAALFERFPMFPPKKHRKGYTFSKGTK